MAFQFEADRPPEIRVVLNTDSAVKCDSHTYDDYLESFKVDGIGNEKLLDMEEEPTRFVLKTDLTYQEKKKLETEHMKMKVGEDGGVDVGAFYIRDMIRYHFIAIANPKSVPLEKHLRFQKDNDGLIRRDFLMRLEKHKVLPHLIKALTNAKGDTKDDQEKK